MTGLYIIAAVCILAGAGLWIGFSWLDRKEQAYWAELNRKAGASHLEYTRQQMEDERIRLQQTRCPYDHELRGDFDAV